MAKREERYLQFPISLIRDLVEDKQSAIGRIFNAGIVKVSDSFKIGLLDASRQVIYDIYRSNSALSDELKSQLRYLESEIIGKNEDPFISGQFDALDEVDELLQEMIVDDTLKNLVCDHYRHQQALKFLGISQSDSVNSRAKGRKILSKIPSKEPNAMINTRHLFNFRDNEKSDYELIQLSAFIGIKSIIGKKAFCKTNKSLIIARMLGYASIKCIPEDLKGRAAEIFKKYSIRYHMDKLLVDLQLNWNVLVYSNHMRGLYVAIDGKINLQSLVKQAEEKKRKNQVQKLKDQKKDALKMVKELQQLK